MSGVWLNTFVTPDVTNGMAGGILGMIFGPDGNLYVSGNDSLGPAIFSFQGPTAVSDQRGKFLRMLPRDAANIQASAAYAFATGGDGKIYYSNPLDSAIRRIDLITGQTEIVFQSFFGRYQLSSIAFGPDGNLYVAMGDGNGDEGRIERLDGRTFTDLGWIARTNDVTTLPPLVYTYLGYQWVMGWGTPIGMAFGPSDGLLYISTTQQQAVVFRASGPDVPAISSLYLDAHTVAGQLLGYIGSQTYGGPVLFDRNRTPTGANVPVSPTTTTSLTFASVATSGVTTVTPLTAASLQPGATLPPNFDLGAASGGLATYFDIHTTAAFTGSVVITVAYDTAQFPWNPVTNPAGAKPALLHYTQGQWVDITTGVDVAKGTVSGTTTSFSPSAIATHHVFSWSGVLRPVNTDGSSIFKQGSTIPVKFSLTGADAGIANLTAKLYLSQSSTVDPVAANEAVSTSAADSGNTFRYDAMAQQYLFNLSTRSLSQGAWRLRIDLGDGTDHVVKIQIKK